MTCLFIGAVCVLMCPSKKWSNKLVLNGLSVLFGPFVCSFVRSCANTWKRLRNIRLHSLLAIVDFCRKHPTHKFCNLECQWKYKFGTDSMECTGLYLGPKCACKSWNVPVNLQTDLYLIKEMWLLKTHSREVSTNVIKILQIKQLYFLHWILKSRGFLPKEKQDLLQK